MIFDQELNKPFKCENCGKMIELKSGVGTKHRNHCPFCLYSKHVDLRQSGDRQAECEGLMKPIGLTFKHEGKDKYGNTRQGELMLVHQCLGKDCDEISINRIAADDDSQAIIDVFDSSLIIDQAIIDQLFASDVDLLQEKDRLAINTQLFGHQ